MPTQDTHLSKATKSIVFLDACEVSDDIKLSANYCDWSVIIKFYVCLHIIEAIGAPKNIHFPNHSTRNSQMYLFTTLYDVEFCNRYLELYGLSLKARYADYSNPTLTNKDLVESDKHYQYIMKYAEDKHGLKLR